MKMCCHYNFGLYNKGVVSVAKGPRRGEAKVQDMSSIFRGKGAKPADLLLENLTMFTSGDFSGPVLDLACGGGGNGILLASRGLRVTLADRSASALAQAQELANKSGVKVDIWEIDLEREGKDPLAGREFGAVLVFRYLHRPLITGIRRCLVEGGLIMYETFTVDQKRFGKPTNPDFLLRPGELMDWFADWECIRHFEGIKDDPPRAVAQLIARKPVTASQC